MLYLPFKVILQHQLRVRFSRHQGTRIEIITGSHVHNDPDHHHHHLDEVLSLVTSSCPANADHNIPSSHRQHDSRSPQYSSPSPSSPPWRLTWSICWAWPTLSIFLYYLTISSIFYLTWSICWAWPALSVTTSRLETPANLHRGATWIRLYISYIYHISYSIHWFYVFPHWTTDVRSPAPPTTVCRGLFHQKGWQTPEWWDTMLCSW